MVILFARRLCGDGFTKKGLSEGEMGLSMALLGYNPCKIFVNASPFRFVSGVVVLLARTPKKIVLGRFQYRARSSCSLQTCSFSCGGAMESIVYRV